MELKNVRFGIELEMFGYYTDDQFINTVHKECEKRLLPINIIHNSDRNVPGYWILKGDSSIVTPKRGVATKVQQVGYRPGEQMFLPMGKMQHIEPEGGEYHTKREVPNYDDVPQDEELPFSESRITSRPDIIAGDEQIKAYKVSRENRGSEDSYKDFELISPPLKFVDSNIKLVGELADVLRRMRMKVNASTGIHVHVSFPEINFFTFVKIMHFVDEKKIEDLWPSRFNKHYAKSKEEMKDDVENYLEDMSASYEGDPDYSKSINYAKINRLMPIANKIDDRYFGVNIQSFEDHGTIEFRYAAGSLRSSEITDWMKYLRDLVDYCLKVKEVNNFLGRFDIKEERDGDIEIHDSQRNVTIKSNNIIDKYVHQKKPVEEFLKENGVNNLKGTIKLIYKYLNRVGQIRTKQISNLFNNIIKFINDLIKTKAFNTSEIEIYNELFDLYANPESVLDAEGEDYDEQYFDDVHEDTFTYIIQNTAFKHMDADKIARFIDSEARAEENKDNSHAIELTKSLTLGLKKEVVNKLDTETLSKIANNLYEDYVNGYQDDNVADELYNFLMKVDSDKVHKIIKGKLKFGTLIEMFGYSPKIMNDLLNVKTYKSLYENNFKKFFSKISDESNISMDGVEQNIDFYADTLGSENMIGLLNKEKYFNNKTAASLYEMIMDTYVIVRDKGKDFTKAYIKKVANSQHASLFTKFIDKDLSNEKVTVFDIYEVLNSVAEGKDWNNIREYSRSKYGPPLINGVNYVKKVDRRLMGLQKDAAADNVVYSEEGKQMTIDLFKLLFKKYHTSKLRWIWKFLMIGVNDFLKPEYMNNVQNKDIDSVVGSYSDLDFPLKEEYKLMPEFMKILVEKSDVIKNKFLLQMIARAEIASSLFKLLKAVITNVDMPSFINAFKNLDLPMKKKLLIYDQIMSRTGYADIGIDQEAFEKGVIDTFKMSNIDTEEDFNQFIEFFSRNYYTTGVSRHLFSTFSEKEKLLVELMVNESYDLNDFMKKKVLDYVKDDDEFAKRIIFAYDIMAYDYGIIRRNVTLMDASFFVEICYALGKKLDDNEINYSMVTASQALHFTNKTRNNINYTKLSMLNDEVVQKFMLTNFNAITQYPLRNGFWKNYDILAPIYDKIIANKKLYKKLLEINDYVITSHLNMLFYYRKMKKMNLKLKAETTDDFSKNVNIAKFKIGEKKYKIEIKATDQIDKIPRHYEYEVFLSVDGKVIDSHKFDASTSQQNLKDAAFFYVYNTLLKNNTFAKTMNIKPKDVNNGEITLKDIILQGMKSLKIDVNKSIEFKGEKKKLNESVVTKEEMIDYHKEFKSIMVKKGISEAKKFLTENKNNIEDRKLVAVMKQFGIR